MKHTSIIVSTFCIPFRHLSLPEKKNLPAHSRALIKVSSTDLLVTSGIYIFWGDLGRVRLLLIGRYVTDIFQYIKITESLSIRLLNITMALPRNKEEAVLKCARTCFLS